MVDNLTEMMHREWNSGIGDANDYNGNSNSNHLGHSRLLARKISDNNGTNNQQSTNDHNDLPSTAFVRTPKPLSNRTSLDAAYDTDGAVGRSGHSAKHHHHSNNYEHLVSPRLPVRRAITQSSKQAATIPLQHRLSHKASLSANSSLAPIYNYDDRDEDSNYENDIRRRPIRLSRRVHQLPTLAGNHGTRMTRPPVVLQHGGPLVGTPSVQSLRIIFMRHGERANQALGPDWFNKAFRTNSYRAYDPNLPYILPKRRFEQAYEFDAPLTG
jgi:hypothetical protein